MSIEERLEDFQQKQRTRKSEKIRKKNDDLFAHGKDFSKKQKGWGTMVETGYGGLNKGNQYNGQLDAEIDSKIFFAEEQKRITEKNEKEHHKQ